MSFSLASALLRGNWLIEPGYAAAQLPLVLELIKAAPSTQSFENVVPKIQNLAPQRLHMVAAAAQPDIYSVGYYTAIDRLPQGSIAMIDIVGPVLKYGGSCSYGSVDTINLLNKIGNNSRIAGVILNVDSPGGQADGTAALADAIRQVLTVKPVISVIQNGRAASAGYWIASAAQEIYATHPTDSFGSIGAYTSFYNMAGYLEKMGVQEIEIYAPQSTDKNKGYKDAIAGDFTLMQDDLKFLVDQFKATVQSNRGPRLKAGKEYPFTGKMYKAADAMKVGLIDGIKPMSGVVARIDQLIKLRV